MGWGPLSPRHLLLGFAAGAGAALLVTAVPALAGLASWSVPESDARFGLGRFLGAAVALLFGAVGEELLFRGYGFQILLARYNPWLVLSAFALLFGVMHHQNPDATLGSDLNTALWGAVLGYALLRSGALWLPIGLHYGWNLLLPAAGSRLSGFDLPIGPRVLVWKLPPLWSGGEYGPEGGLLCTLAALVVLLWLWKWPLQPQPGLLLDASKRT
jgi:membrane protease YdiL (CAAX protease family)